MLAPRTATILKSIVEQYIARAVPVPSQGIRDEYELGVSPATIRNEMAHLEQEGYILRRHSSAGSIPSDKGYRYFVESLRHVSLPLDEQNLVSHLFHQVEEELEKWLDLASIVAARLTENFAVVTIPKPADCRFKYLELIALQESLVLVVLILQGARLKQKLITCDQVITQSELTLTANRLNTTFSGLTRAQIPARVIVLSPLEQQLFDCLLKMMRDEDRQEYEEPYIDGWHFILRQPEFIHSHKMIALMELVEQRRLLMSMVPPEPSNNRVQVIIGKENETEAFHNYSVVISRYGVPGEALGTIGIIGPTRMAYARTISTVDFLSSVLSHLVGELYGKINTAEPDMNSKA